VPLASSKSQHATNPLVNGLWIGDGVIDGVLDIDILGVLDIDGDGVGDCETPIDDDTEMLGVLVFETDIDGVGDCETAIDDDTEMLGVLVFESDIDGVVVDVGDGLGGW